MGFQGGNIGLRKCESIESRAFRRLPVSGKGLFVLFRNLIAKRGEKKSERKVSFRMEILELNQMKFRRIQFFKFQCSI